MTAKPRRERQMQWDEICFILMMICILVLSLSGSYWLIASAHQKYIETQIETENASFLFTNND